MTIKFKTRPAIGRPVMYRGRRWRVSAIAPAWLTLTAISVPVGTEPGIKDIACAKWSITS